jgi:hypothetical protein
VINCLRGEAFEEMSAIVGHLFSIGVYNQK